jgi:hypothetical protein
MMLCEKIGERFICKLLKASPSLLPHQINGGPGLIIEFDAFADHVSATIARRGDEGAVKSRGVIAEPGAGNVQAAPEKTFNEIEHCELPFWRNSTPERTQGSTSRLR